MLRFTHTSALALLLSTSLMGSMAQAQGLSLEGLFGRPAAQPAAPSEVAPTANRTQTSAQPAAPTTAQPAQTRAQTAQTPQDFDALREHLNRELLRLSSEAIRFDTGTQVPSTPITIQDLDRQQRELLQEQQRAQIEEQQGRILQSRIELILLLREVMDALDETPAAEQQTAAAPIVPQVDVEALRREWEAEQRQAERRQQEEEQRRAMDAERASLPSLVRIEGAGGRMMAVMIDENGARSEWMVGETLPGGFVMDNITSRNAVLRGMRTGEVYVVSPTVTGDQGGTFRVGTPTTGTQAPGAQGAPRNIDDLRLRTENGLDSMAVQDFMRFVNSPTPRVHGGPGSDD